MATVIMNLLAQRNLSIYDVARKSGVSKSTLQNASEKPIENWSIRVLNAFAKGLGKKSSELLDILQPNNYNLEINNSAQTIQGVYIPNKQTFLNIRFTVEMEHMEGWNPTKRDIEYLLNEAERPDPELTAQIEQVFGKQNNEH
jgi:transcriptional regulator with XRE-family HTH domain